mmetsp:Transcript_73332/g.185750  ORF Transcript_73332/g.185750 Transcript_73332/m.185750 type:complete len:221 (-) Transcript_73332:37-699(-)
MEGDGCELVGPRAGWLPAESALRRALREPTGRAVGGPPAVAADRGRRRFAQGGCVDAQGEGWSLGTASRRLAGPLQCHVAFDCEAALEGRVAWWLQGDEHPAEAAGRADVGQAFHAAHPPAARSRRLPRADDFGLHVRGARGRAGSRSKKSRGDCRGTRGAPRRAAAAPLAEGAGGTPGEDSRSGRSGDAGLAVTPRAARGFFLLRQASACTPTPQVNKV